MRTGFTEVTIRGVVIDPMTGEPAVLLEDDSESAIIAVAAVPSVTGAIISELEGIESDQSQTLLYRFLVRHSISVLRIELAHTAEGDLCAAFDYMYEGAQYRMEVRPIDGLLVAVQTNAPIFATAALIRDRAVPAAPRVLDGGDLLILSRRVTR
jgi:bifunctional DNase/RNase